MWKKKRQAEIAYLIAVIIACLVAFIYLYIASQISF